MAEAGRESRALDARRVRKHYRGLAASYERKANVACRTACLELARSHLRGCRRLLEVGAGSATLVARLEAPLRSACDLSLPMLQKAHERISSVNSGKINLIQGDFRNIALPDDEYDVVLATAVLHHLRDDQDWETAFRKIFRLTAPGGSVWITDFISHESEPVQALMWDRYGEYLVAVGGEDYKTKVFDYIDQEDSPRPVTYQLNLLREVGFNQVEILHKNACFAAFGAIKRGKTG